MIIGPQFIWLHFPKCAGTTVEAALRTLTAGRSDVQFDHVFATSDLSQVNWHQNLRQRRDEDSSFVSDGKVIIANFRRLPDWILSRVHFTARVLPDLHPTRQMLTAGRFFEADGSVKSADEELALYLEEPVSHWIRAEHLADDFKRAFGPYFDLSSGHYRAILEKRHNSGDNYINNTAFNFTDKEIQRLYLLNPTWAELEAKLYGDVVRLPALSPSDKAAGVSDCSVVAVIPLYNGASFIEEAIRSVLAQTVKPDEFLIVDDGSTDEGAEIVMRFGQAHLTLLRKENGGQSSARNHGVKHSTSSLIAFLDQDDAWHPHHLEELLKPFQERRGIAIGWSYSNLDEIDEKGQLVNRGVLDLLPITHPKRSLNTCLREDMFVLPSASLISRTAFDLVGGFDEQLLGYEDDDLFLRLFRAGYDNVYLNQPLSKWRIYSLSSSFSERMGMSRIKYFRKLCISFPDNRPRNLFYARDLLAPRFSRNILLEYDRALNVGNKKRMAIAVADLRIVSQYLPRRRRLMTTMVGVFGRSVPGGRLAKRTYLLLKRLGIRLF